MPLFISGTEIIFIFFIILLIFGADRIPEIARGLGKGMTQVKNATNEIKNEIQRSAQKEGLDTEGIQKQIDEVKEDFNDLTDSIKRNL
ncbi:MAG: twin-arginine translocase TatA/TatE family subunit [Flavobacteriaceae bacterium]|nr:twin-arginine translocase TatA/TatE family subunit [Flavobacteriaceae bacterium]